MKNIFKYFVIVPILLLSTSIVLAQFNGGGNNQAGKRKNKNNHDKAMSVFIEATYNDPGEIADTYRIIEYKIYPPCGDQDFPRSLKFALFAEQTDGTEIQLDDPVGDAIEEVHTDVHPPVDAFPNNVYSQMTGNDASKIYVKSIVNGRNEAIASNWSFNNIFITDPPEEAYIKIVGINVWNPTLATRKVGLNIFYSPPIIVIPDGEGWGYHRFKVLRKVNGGAEAVVKTVPIGLEERGAFIVDDTETFAPDDRVVYRVLREIAFTDGGEPDEGDWEADDDNPNHEAKRSVYIPVVSCRYVD